MAEKAVKLKSYTMLEYQQKRKLKKRIYSPITLVALLIICIYLIYATWNIYTKHRTSAREVSRSETELKELEARQANLQNEIDLLHTTAGVEGEIREKFNVAKPGENTIIIVDQSNTTTTSFRTSFFGNIWHTVTGLFGR